MISGVRTCGGNDCFQSSLLFGQLVEICIRLGIGSVDGFEFLLCLHHFAHTRFDFLAHGLFRVQLRLLRQVADGNTRLPLHLAVKLLVRAGHDFQHGGFPRAVQTQQADFCAGEKGQGDVLDDLPLGRHDFAHMEHGHDVLGHLRNQLPENQNRIIREAGEAASIKSSLWLHLFNPEGESGLNYVTHMKEG